MKTRLLLLCVLIFCCRINIGFAASGFLLSADGVPIHFQIFGQGEPELVFVHGWGCNQKFWRYQQIHFSQNHKTVTLDLVGHGKSGHDRQEWTIDNFSDDLVSIIKKLDLKNAILIGHSLGRAIILDAACKYPDRVIGLIGIETLPSVYSASSHHTFREFIKPFHSNFKRTTKKYFHKLIDHSNQELVHDILTCLSNFKKESGIGALEALMNYDFRTKIMQLSVPIWSIQSVNHSTEQDSIAHRVNIVQMKNAGHFPMLERPASFNKILKEIIDKFEYQFITRQKDKKNYLLDIVDNK